MFKFIKGLVIFECKRNGLSLALIRMKFGYVSTTASLSLGDSDLSRPNRRWCSKDKVSRQVRGGLGPCSTHVSVTQTLSVT